MAEMEMDINKTFAAAVETSKKIEADLAVNPTKYRILTGDRPTGRLHIGHYFGTLQNRVRLQNMGIPTMILIADYQVLTDHDAFSEISQNTKQLVIDYIAAGIDPARDNVIIYPHSYVPECNQLMLPFLTLVSNAELSRNPTVKEEIQSAGIKNVNAGMYTYPIHQACDILFCKGNLVPVGKDQLPHLELTRTIARRFNEKFCKDREPIFPMPQALLSKVPAVMGLDGQKMSKSRHNAIFLSSTEDETAKLIKKATTDGERHISYDPVNRPNVANLIDLIALCTKEEPVAIAERIGDGGGGMLKNQLTEALNEHLRPLRAKRAELEKNPDYIKKVLIEGSNKAREIAQKTLEEVREAMNMKI
jgi:tryptophanyl-tRNA synthetase